MNGFQRVLAVIQTPAFIWTAVVLFTAWIVFQAVTARPPENIETLPIFLLSMPFFMVKISVYAGFALMLNWVFNRVRASKWYDGPGAGEEMAVVRARMGTTNECANDAMACAIQFLANAILIATVMAMMFLLAG